MTEEPPDAPRLCLALPFYSNVEYLAVALQSLMVQSDPHWTAIVVDDASPDPGAEKMLAALRDRRVRYVRNEQNLGVAANFNRCLELGAAGAEIVTVFHADDELEPGYVAAVRAAHRRFPEATCVAPRVTVIDGKGMPTRTLGDSVKRLLWPRQVADDAGGGRGARQVDARVVLLLSIGLLPGRPATRTSLRRALATGDGPRPVCTYVARRGLDRARP